MPSIELFILFERTQRKNWFYLSFLSYFLEYFQRHPLDTKYFDSQFTRERARLTPIDKNILISMDQKQFEGFSYTNPNATLTWISQSFFIYIFSFSFSSPLLLLCTHNQSVVVPPGPPWWAAPYHGARHDLISHILGEKGAWTSKFHLFENVFSVTNNHFSRERSNLFHRSVRRCWHKSFYLLIMIFLFFFFYNFMISLCHALLHCLPFLWFLCAHFFIFYLLRTIAPTWTWATHHYPHNPPPTPKNPLNFFLIFY